MHSPATQRSTKSEPKIIRSLSYLFPTRGSDSLAIVAFTQVWTPIKDCPICDVHFTLWVTLNCWEPTRTWFFFLPKLLYICTTQTRSIMWPRIDSMTATDKKIYSVGLEHLSRQLWSFKLMDLLFVELLSFIRWAALPILYGIALHPMWRFEQKRPVCVSQSQEWSLTVGNSGDDDGRMSLDKSLCIPCTTNRRSCSSAVQRLCEVRL